MNQRLKAYLDRCGRATMDDTILDDLRKEMEQAVPEIAQTISAAGATGPLNCEFPHQVPRSPPAKNKTSLSTTAA